MRNTVHFILLYALLISLAVFSVYSLSKHKTAYLDMQSVFNDFKLKHTLENKLTNAEAARKSVLDSMLMQLKIMDEELSRKPDNVLVRRLYETGKEEYIEKEQQFKEDSQRQAEEYDKQIWKQLNQYISQYGKENNYSLILGADGSGHVMYAEEKMNITAEVKEFVNNKYDGK